MYPSTSSLPIQIVKKPKPTDLTPTKNSETKRFNLMLHFHDGNAHDKDVGEKIHALRKDKYDLFVSIDPSIEDYDVTARVRDSLTELNTVFDDIKVFVAGHHRTLRNSPKGLVSMPPADRRIGGRPLEEVTALLGKCCNTIARSQPFSVNVDMRFACQTGITSASPKLYAELLEEEKKLKGTAEIATLHRTIGRELVETTSLPADITTSEYVAVSLGRMTDATRIAVSGVNGSMSGPSGQMAVVLNPNYYTPLTEEQKTHFLRELAHHQKNKVFTDKSIAEDPATVQMLMNHRKTTFTLAK
jgi:hypothetical protein